MQRTPPPVPIRPPPARPRRPGPRTGAAAPRPASLCLLAVLCLSLACSPGKRASVRAVCGNDGVVVSSHPAATAIGVAVLEAGGNAVDAAVATGLAVGVADPFNSGIGGGGVAVVRLADGSAFAVDGREAAPAAATRDMFVRDGKVRPKLSRRGPLAVAVPGLLACYGRLLEHAGSMPLQRLIEPSAELAERGFALDAYDQERYRVSADLLRKDLASRRVFLRPDGTPPGAGEVLRQPELAETYRQIAAGGLDAFYRGPFARRMADVMARRGGLISLADMAAYRAKVLPPLTGTYRGTEVIAMPLPSSGGIVLLEVLNMLEASGVLAGRGRWDREAVAWTVRFLTRAFQDRASHLGDGATPPGAVQRLTSKAYARRCVRELMAPVGREAAAGGHGGNAPGGHTTNIAVVDRWGNAVSINQSLNLSFGAKFTLPGTGVLLNNQMDDFSAQPGVPNAFGLVGAEANAVAPGKRPLSSMCPAIVVRDRRPLLILGGAGGPRIISAVLQTLVDVVDFRMSLPQSLLLPRFHHQHAPDLLFVEEATPRLSRWGLRLSGPPVSVAPGPLGVVNAIAWEPAGQCYAGAADPRARGEALAVPAAPLPAAPPGRDPA